LRDLPSQYQAVQVKGGASGTTQVDATTQAVTRRRTGIFGAPRGAQPSNWVGDKGFVGGTRDGDTGLTHLGAREYDPAIGRFISVDPVIDITDPLQMDGYGYSHNNPITRSDPTGLIDPDERDYCDANPTQCEGGRLKHVKPRKALTSLEKGGKIVTVYDKQGVPHHTVGQPDNTASKTALKEINDDLRRAGLYYDPKTGNGEMYLSQDDGKAGETTVKKEAPIKDGDGKSVRAGTTADFVKVTWKNGKIIDVDSYDATTANTVKSGKTTIGNKFTKKNQANNVIFVAQDLAHAEELAAFYEDDPHVRIIFPEGGFDSRRASVSLAAVGRPKLPKLRAFGLVGGALAVGQAPSYVREYGWMRGGWEMFKTRCLRSASPTACRIRSLRSRITAPPIRSRVPR
ncbi:RHS repeat-associated core domain-containing protein, partial [Streptomyces sp. NPDC057575]